MKKNSFYILGVLLYLCTNSYGQINFPDPNFKQALLTHSPIIDTSGNGEIEEAEALNIDRLNLDNKNISSLEGIQFFKNLDILDCSDNNIKKINDSQTYTLTKLRFLTARRNQISSIDVRNCKLWGLHLEGNPIKYAYLTGSSTFQMEGRWGIIFDLNNIEYVCINNDQYMPQSNNVDHRYFWNRIGSALHIGECTIVTTPVCPIINFPDPNFKQALLNISPAIDTDGDGEICIEEAEIVTYLPLDGKNINDVTGIEYFINIEVLKLNDNNIVSADLSNNLKIRNLSVINNNLTNLNVTNNEALVSLYASNNKLTSIDISTNKSLKVLHLYDNNISQLDASNLTQLTFIGIDNNSLTSLNITNCYTLEAIQARNNQLSQLDISTNSNLGVLQVPNNKLTGLNITSNNSKLKQLLINQNLINKIDIRNCNSMSRLDIRNNPNLKEAFLTGSHSFYSSFDNFGDLTRDNYISINNCPKLNFVCVNNVSFFNDIKNYITGMYPLCTVNTDCTLPRNDFSSYFILSPNPTTGSMILSKKDTGTTASTADIFNAQTGSFVKSVNLLFGGGFGNLSFKKTTTSTTTQRLGNPINLEDGAPINVTDLATGSYIFRVNSNRGTHTTNFIKM
ncbi:leucine-rich repeat domain-containing protein [Tenacibaculum sp. IMCC1]|uniref:T9SS type A sorting domain-containing protein n=2 Tax=unclassified Tenacibaculum TaxID=2635139 RepID=A0AB33L0M6_9FLAO